MFGWSLANWNVLFNGDELSTNGTPWYVQLSKHALVVCFRGWQLWKKLLKTIVIEKIEKCKEFRWSQYVPACHDVILLLQESFVDQESRDLDLLHMYGQSKQERREHLSQRVRKTRLGPFCFERFLCLKGQSSAIPVARCRRWKTTSVALEVPQMCKPSRLPGSRDVKTGFRFVVSPCVCMGWCAPRSFGASSQNFCVIPNLKAQSMAYHQPEPAQTSDLWGKCISKFLPMAVWSPRRPNT